MLQKKLVWLNKYFLERRISKFSQNNVDQMFQEAKGTALYS